MISFFKEYSRFIVLAIIGLGIFYLEHAWIAKHEVHNEEIIEARFACGEYHSIQATFHVESKTVDLNLSDMRKMTLKQTVSASGARYANKDESFVFWNKGNNAFIEERGKKTYDNCEVK
jgi:membrane-bound inhibitor of C-type lysozyme